MRDGKFSQSDEDFIISEYFASKPHGTFIDIGSNDGITFSNTRLMALKGWKGVFVDPSPKAYEKLVELYKGFKGFYTYNVALSNHNGRAILHESGPLCSAKDVGLVSTFHQHEIDRFKASISYEAVTVKCFRWKKFLNRLSIRKFDLISMDCESEEMNILPDMDLTHTSLLCIEHNSKPELKRQYLECTSRYGMDRIIYESAENIIIAR